MPLQFYLSYTPQNIVAFFDALFVCGGDSHLIESGHYLIAARRDIGIQGYDPVS